MATQDYIPVAGDDWYQRRRDDAEGRFFRHVADQGPRKGEDGATRQGIYCLTADGQLLYWKNAGQLPGEMRKALRWGLDAWNRLPADERRPGAIRVPELARVDPNYDRRPPEGGLILNVYTRILDLDAGGKLCKGACKVAGADAPAHDHMWLTRAEWKSLIPANPRVGQRVPLPEPIAERLLRFHLIDNTRGEPPMWERRDIRGHELGLTVEEADADRVLLRLEGTALLATGADVERAERGFDARLLGYVGYNTRRQVIERFDLVAVGDHWGEGAFTGNARRGRKPLGVALELARPDSAADRVPPQAARESARYFGRGE